MSLKQVNCNHCGREFNARSADIARGWGKFCSKRCKAKEQEARTGQYARVKGKTEGDSADNCGHPFDSGYFGHGQN